MEKEQTLQQKELVFLACDAKAYKEKELWEKLLEEK